MRSVEGIAFLEKVLYKCLHCQILLTMYFMECVKISYSGLEVKILSSVMAMCCNVVLNSFSWEGIHYDTTKWYNENLPKIKKHNYLRIGLVVNAGNFVCMKLLYQFLYTFCKWSIFGMISCCQIIELHHFFCSSSSSIP